MAAWKGIVGEGMTANQFDDYVGTVQFGPWRPQFVVLHNTAEPTFATWHSVPGRQRMRGLQNYYRDDQKWSGGPHLFVADDLIWAFTPLSVPGVHAPSWNQVSWGVEMVGEYNTEDMCDGVRENTIRTLTTLHSLAGFDPGTLRLHHEDPLTTHKGCPGTKVVKDDFVAAVRDRLTALHSGEHLPNRPSA